MLSAVAIVLATVGMACLAMSQPRHRQKWHPRQLPGQPLLRQSGAVLLCVCAAILVYRHGMAIGIVAGISSFFLGGAIVAAALSAK